MPSIWSRTTSFIAGIAVGGAVEEAVAPTLEPLQQTAWANQPAKVLDPGTAAQADVQGLGDPVDLEDDVARNGFGPARWQILRELAVGAPATAELLELWRRGKIDETLFDHGLRKAQVDERYWPAIKELFGERLDPASIANAVQQGFMDNPGLLPVSVPTTPGKVPSTEPVNLDTLAEAQASGFDKERMKVLARLAGLPPGPEELLAMVRRGIITEDDFRRGVAAGHTKTEWADAYLETLEPLLSPATAATLRLKGWIDEAEAARLGALNGFTADQMQRLYEAGGRPAAPGQMATAVARGFATEADFKLAIRQSDIRPEYGQTLFDIRFHYPSLFFTKAAVAGGNVADADAVEWLTNQLYPPDVAAKLVASFHKEKTGHVKDLTRADILLFYGARYIDADRATVDLTNLGYAPDEIVLLLEHEDAQRIKRFMDAQVNRVHARYVGWKIDRPTAVNEIGALGIPASARDDMLGLWDAEREGNHPILTAAQIEALLKEGHITSQAAYGSLVLRGYSDLAARALVSRYAALGAPGSLNAVLDQPV